MIKCVYLHIKFYHQPWHMIILFFNNKFNQICKCPLNILAHISDGFQIVLYSGAVFLNVTAGVGMVQLGFVI